MNIEEDIKQNDKEINLSGASDTILIFNRIQYCFRPSEMTIFYCNKKVGKSVIAKDRIVDHHQRTFRS